MKEEVWGPIWGLTGTNGQDWLWWDKWQGEGGSWCGAGGRGPGSQVWAFLSRDRRLRDGGNPGGDGRTFLLEPPGDEGL